MPVTSTAPCADLATDLEARGKANEHRLPGTGDCDTDVSMTSAAVPDKHYFVALKGALSAHQVLLLPFRDKDGSISLHPAHSPKLDRLPKLVQEERYTSIVIMSHGWNTTPYDGRLMYRYWFSHLQEANAAVADGDKLGVKPLFIGIYWPSIILAPTWDSYIAEPTIKEDTAVLTPEEMAQRLALRGMRDLGERLKRSLEGGDMEQKVVDELMHAAYVSLDGEALAATSLADGSRSDVDKKKVKERLMGAVRGDSELTYLMTAGKATVANKAVGLAQNLTLGPMKKLAGEIGASAVFQTFLMEQAFASGVPVHLQGHSLGCKVMLEAVLHYTKNNPGGPKPRSLTLIQVSMGAGGGVWLLSGVSLASRPSSTRVLSPDGASASASSSLTPSTLARGRPVSTTPSPRPLRRLSSCCTGGAAAGGGGGWKQNRRTATPLLRPPSRAAQRE